MHAYIVVDLGFGDAGKGLLTDFLVRHFKSGLVVRYNGGAQAGHNVVTPDGRHHTFSQFGSGTFVSNVKTYLSHQVVIDPLALLVEGDSLEGKGARNVFARLRISDRALVITPFHRATNRIRELVRGANRHGSCGIGVGEAFEDALQHPEIRVLARDLNNPVRLRQKLRATRDLKCEQILTFCKDNSFSLSTVQEYEVFEREDLIDLWIAAIARIGELDLVVPDSLLERWFRETDNVIFEGAQGVLLDADAGFHPYTTWSRSTGENAIDLIEQMIPDAQVYQIGVMRSYSVRHGPGPIPTETDALKTVVTEHNNYNKWQGNVRYGWFDPILLHYALHVIGGVDSIAVTHLDILSSLKSWNYCYGYQGHHDLYNTSAVTTISDGVLTNFDIPLSLPLAERTRITQALSAVTPVFHNCDTDDTTVIQNIEMLLGHQVGIVSYGQSAEDVKITNTFFL